MNGRDPRAGPYPVAMRARPIRLCLLLCLIAACAAEGNEPQPTPESIWDHVFQLLEVG